MARAVRTNWRLKSMANCPNSRGPGAHDIDSKDEPVAPYDYDAEKSAGRNQPVAAAQASRGASLLPDVHLQIAFTICRRSRAPDKPPSCPSPRCRSGCRCDAPCRGRPRIWIDEPGICGSRFDAVMCDTCVLSTPCVVCVGGSAIESMTRHPRQLAPSARCAPHRCRRSQRRSYLSTTISRKPDRSWARNHFSRLAQVARPRQRLAGSRSPACIIRMRSAATMCALVIAA